MNNKMICIRISDELYKKLKQMKINKEIKNVSDYIKKLLVGK